MDLWDYFEQRRQICEKAQLEPVGGGGWDAIFREEADSGGKMGMMLGRFRFPHREDALLKVYERILCPGRPGRDVHRVSYSYFLTVDGEEVWGRERDPDHDPAEHGHGPGHARVPAGRISLKRAIEEAFAELDRIDADVGQAE